MRWSWFGLRPNLERIWSFDAGANVWRLIPSATGHIVGEVRNHEKKQASFFCLDESSGRALWRDRTFEEPWWIGVEAVTGDVIILHTYEKPDMPQHRAMIAIDARSGLEIWREPDAAFVFLSGASVYGLRQQLGMRSVVELELRTGTLVRIFDETVPEFGELRSSATPSIDMGQIELAAPYEPGSDPACDSAVNRSILRNLAATGLESLRMDDYLLVSFFVQSAGGKGLRSEFENHFRVVDLGSGKTLHDEILARSVPAPVPDTFYVRHGAVVSVKDLHVVQAHRLSH